MPATFLFELDADGITRFVSAEAVDLTGYAPSELVGRDFWGVLCPAELRAQITFGRDGSLPVPGTHRLVILSKAGALTPRDVHLAYRQGADGAGSWFYLPFRWLVGGVSI